MRLPTDKQVLAVLGRVPPWAWIAAGGVGLYLVTRRTASPRALPAPAPSPPRPAPRPSPSPVPPPEPGPSPSPPEPAPPPRTRPVQLPPGPIRLEPGVRYMTTFQVRGFLARKLATPERVRAEATSEGFQDVIVRTVPTPPLAPGDYYVIGTYAGTPRTIEREQAGGDVRIVDAWRLESVS